MSLKFLPFFAHASFKNMVATLACKKCNMPVGLCLHFSRLALAELVYLFFCLDAKEPKNQGCEKIG